MGVARVMPDNRHTLGADNVRVDADCELIVAASNRRAVRVDCPGTVERDCCFAKYAPVGVGTIRQDDPHNIADLGPGASHG